MRRTHIYLERVAFADRVLILLPKAPSDMVVWYQLSLHENVDKVLMEYQASTWMILTRLLIYS